MDTTQLPAPPKNWWARNKGRIAAGALIWFGLAVAIGVVQDDTEQSPTTSVTIQDPVAMDHQVGYVSSEVTTAVAEVAAEDPTLAGQVCDELSTFSYSSALGVAENEATAGGFPGRGEEMLDGWILYCRSH